MVQRVSIQFIDDLDGASDASHTVAFQLDGCDYDIDLSEEHMMELRAALQRYVDAARRVP